ncbi:MAG: carbohydrate ABC transporter permease [Anaerolineae bacterium]
MTTQTATMPGRAVPRRSARQRLVARFLRHGVTALIAYFFLFAVGLLFAIPFLWLIITSLKPINQVFTIPLTWIPHPIMWSNYPDALKHSGFPFVKLVRNSLNYAVFSTLGVTIASAIAAYSFARIPFRGRSFWFAITLGTMMIPGVVTMIPTYLIFKWLGWVGSYKPLIIPSWGGAPFFIFMLRQFMMTLPWEMSDAARVDGASEAHILARIMLPLMKPALLVVVIFNFMWCWNDFMGPIIYLQNTNLYPLSLGLYTFMSRGQRAWNLLMAASLIVTAPIVIIFFLAQRQFIEGITMTGIKG